MDDQALNRKMQDLARRLRRLKGLLVAFSGGVDSAFLLAVAKHVMGKGVVAVTACSPIHPRREREQAVEFAKNLGAEHLLLDTHELEHCEFYSNPPQRCYWCKKGLFQQLLGLAAARGIPHVAHGANVDDLEDFRPGTQAAEELKILAPLTDAGLTKRHIRLLARRLELEIWDKPSAACLASRIPYGEPITAEKLQLVEHAEAFLLEKGFRQCRVRHHGTVARIELDPEEIPRMLDRGLSEETSRKFREIGFLYTSVDIEGYGTGRLNRELERGDKTKSRSRAEARRRREKISG